MSTVFRKRKSGRRLIFLFILITAFSAWQLLPSKESTAETAVKPTTETVVSVPRRHVRLTAERPIYPVSLSPGEYSPVFSAIGAKKFGWDTPTDCVGVLINGKNPRFDCPEGSHLDVDLMLGKVGEFRTLQFRAPDDRGVSLTAYSMF